MNTAYAANMDTSGPTCDPEREPFLGDAPYQQRGERGRLGCGTSGKQPFLGWTSDRLRIATFAFQGYDPAALIDWWRTDAGPV
jgi:hypothetical protein